MILLMFSSLKIFDISDRSYWIWSELKMISSSFWISDSLASFRVIRIIRLCFRVRKSFFLNYWLVKLISSEKSLNILHKVSILSITVVFSSPYLINCAFFMKEIIKSSLLKSSFPLKSGFILKISETFRIWAS